MENREDQTLTDGMITIAAREKMFDTIDLTQFNGDNDEAAHLIFETLSKELELIPFCEHLKQDLIQLAHIHKNVDELSDSEWVDSIVDLFVKNNCVSLTDATSKKAFRRKANRWIQAQTIKRNAMFEIGFGLGMDAKLISKYLQNILKEQDFDFKDYKETIYYYCRKKNKSKAEAERLLTEYETLPVNHNLKKDSPRVKDMIMRPERYLVSETLLKEYLSYLKQLTDADKKETYAREAFIKLFEYAKEITVRYHKIGDEIDSEIDENENIEITPSSIEDILYSSVPKNSAGNLLPFAKLKKQFSQKRLSRQRISMILNGSQAVERFDIITLYFYNYSLNLLIDDEKSNMKIALRFYDFTNSVNNCLKNIGMSKLYYPNPYESFILLCIATEYPLDTFVQVWEKSYE